MDLEIDFKNMYGKQIILLQEYNQMGTVIA